MSVTDAATAVPMPLMHTVELNAGTVDTDDRPAAARQLDVGASALDQAQISRLSQLWFDALAGICAHVQHGGGGLTPSDIAPARLSQHQIDQLHAAPPDRRRAAADPAATGTALSRQHRTRISAMLYAMQLDITVTGPLDPRRLRDAVHTVVNRHPNLAARFCQQFDEPVQIIPADPIVPWRYVDYAGDYRGAGPAGVRRRTRRGLRPRPPAGLSGGVIRTADDRHRVVLTNHHIVVDGWSLPILLQEIFASYHGQRLPAPAPYRRFVTWLADRDLDAAHAAWREVLAGFDTPTLVGPPGRLGLGGEALTSYRVPAETTRALGELARSHHTTVNTVLQAAWAQLLMWLTGQHDVAFGTAVSGRPAEVPGAESMVGLLINTVPVRAHITPATTTADLLDQLHSANNHTLDHQHLALSEIHRVTGHDHLFDTLFVYENYPIDTGALSGADELAITEFTTSESTHYPLTLQARAGPRAGPSPRIRHRPVRRGHHRGARSTGSSGCWWRWPPIPHGGSRRWMCSMPVSTPGWMSSATGRC